MEKYSKWVNNDVIIEKVDPLVTNLVKTFNEDDLMTYLKGLCVKYLDIYEVKKIVSKLDDLETYANYMYVYNKVESFLDNSEIKKFTIMKKLFKKDFDSNKNKKVEDDNKV